MIVGVPREIKPGEQRVALTPAGARALSEAGHGVIVERGAGARQRHPRRGVCGGGRRARHRRRACGRGRPDPQGQGAHCRRVPRIFARDRSLFTYLHLAAAPELTRELMRAGVIAIAYETVRARRPQPPPADADERGGRAPRRPGRRLLSRPSPRRARHPAVGRARRAARQRGHHRRGRGRAQRGEERGGARRRRLAPRHQPGPPPPC